VEELNNNTKDQLRCVSMTLTKKMEFVRKSQLDTSQVTIENPETRRIIEEAKPEDILGLTITINSPVKIVDAQVVNDDSFAELFFDGANC
jgi:hypothetical protein